MYMSEIFSSNEQNNTNEISTISVFDNAENIIGNEAKTFAERNKDDSESLKSLRSFLNIQKQERVEVDNNYKLSKNDLRFETKMGFENWDKINKAQDILYSNLDINPKLELNDSIWKFRKWVVDWLILDNIELVEELLDKKLEEVLELLSKLVDKDTIFAIIKDIFSSFWDILNTFSEPYEWWVALGWMWLWIIWKSMKWLKVAEKLWEDNNLYDIKEYSFLEKHKDILGEKLNINDIIWEWNNAIILKHPKKEDLVIKIAKPWEVDSLVNEFKNHNKFRKLLLDWKKENFIDNSISIPKITKWEKDWYFIMEKIEWQNLNTITLKNKLKNTFKDESNDFLNNLSDIELKWLLINKYWKSEKLLEQIRIDYSWDLMWDLMWTSNEYFKKYWKKWWTSLQKAEQYFYDKWKLLHDDFHPWNIMIDKNWKIYIIDFGKVLDFNKN